MRASSYHHGDLANQLVAVALALVEEHGADAFSLREAATRCEVAVSSAYKHFASKGELLRAVADRGFEQLAQRMARRVRATTGGKVGVALAEARLFELGRSYILFATEHPNLFRLMYGPGGTGGDQRPDAPARRQLLEALAEVRRVHGHSPADLEASMVIAWSTVHGFAVMVIDGVWKPRDRARFDAMIAGLGEAVLRALR